ncbi:hypothetical protein NLG97_g1312 [Lecanicillium saksenae]|uniref:Uncharacterized protein n=1 Tax=Lecanicillium saksenae TaxID=468837 RepID=A0ACC1R604_9HYPO|nr:hypothetical protein NLG97_g1312 [Lecanicillium saksenae]
MPSAMSLPYSCTKESSSQRSGCSAESPISIAASPASSVSVGGEESASQGYGVSADAPTSAASSPASSASSCGTLSVRGTEELEANPGLDRLNSSFSGVVGGTTTIPAEDADRIRALMAKYENVMSGDGVGTRYACSDTLTHEGGRSASLPGTLNHDDRIDNKPTKPGVPQRKLTSRGTRRDKKGPSGARSRVQKKSASVSRRQAYAFERLGSARRAAHGAIEYEVYWAPTWLPLDHIEGDAAVQEAKDVVLHLFGPDTWRKEAEKLRLLL